MYKKNVVSYKLENGGFVLIEVEKTDFESDPGPVSLIRGMTIEAEKTFEQALDDLIPVAHIIAKKFGNFDIPPTNIGVEFGIKMSAREGAIIAAEGTEANFKITLSWNRA